MNYYLKEKVLTDINIRIKEDAKKERIKNNEARKLIMKYFEDALAKHLENFENYHFHFIPYCNETTPCNFEKNAKKLGFYFEFERDCSNSNYFYYKLSIPFFKKGNRLTPAESMLYKFKKELARKKRERILQLFTDCIRIKNELDKGNYKLFTTSENKEIFIIYTNVSFNTDIEKNTVFEQNIIKSFFLNYGLAIRTDLPEMIPKRIMLYKFKDENFLSKKKRIHQIFAICAYIKNKIEKGNYKYSISEQNKKTITVNINTTLIMILKEKLSKIYF